MRKSVAFKGKGLHKVKKDVRQQTNEGVAKFGLFEVS
jgi:hypothetical protein